jgi:uncharacterized protein (TIGR02466 family)
MKQIKHDLWSTPLWEVETGLNSRFNDTLLQELKGLPDDLQNNIWQHSTPCLDILKSLIFDVLDDNIKDYFPDYYPYEPYLINGWVNYISKDKDLPLHHHGGFLLSCTYYIKTPVGCGDLILVDPRGGCNWEWLEEDSYKDIRYKRVEAKESKLVLFPGFVIHQVERNTSEEKRISLTTNIHNGLINTIGR